MHREKERCRREERKNESDIKRREIGPVRVKDTEKREKRQNRERERERER